MKKLIAVLLLVATLSWGADKTVYVQPAGGDYPSLGAAIAGEAADLVAMGGILHVAIRGDWSGGADTATVDIDGYTTSATCYIHIYTDSANRGGVWNTTKYIRSASDANAILIREDYVWIDGLQIQVVAQTGSRVFFQNVSRTSGGIKISNCILIGDNGAQSLQFYTEASGLFTPVTMWNCIAYNWGSSDNSYFSVGSAATFVVYNSTFIWPATTDSGCKNVSGTLTMINCYSGGSPAGRDYVGTITMTTCASSDTTGTLDNIAINTTNFTTVTGGSKDFRLPNGSALIGVGTDNPGTGLYSDDIEGQTRVSTWDIGADEYVTGGGSVVPQLMYYYRSQD